MIKEWKERQGLAALSCLKLEIGWKSGAIAPVDQQASGQHLAGFFP